LIIIILISNLQKILFAFYITFPIATTLYKLVERYIEKLLSLQIPLPLPLPSYIHTDTSYIHTDTLSIMPFEIDQFPGSINPDDNTYVMGPVFNEIKTKKLNTWVIKARLVKEGANEAKRRINWDTTEDIVVVIDKSYFESGDNIPGAIAQYWVELQLDGGKLSVKPPKYETVDKNIGKANQQNVLMSALIKMRDQYRKRIDQGGSLSRSDVADTYGKVILSRNKIYKPMLAESYNDNRSLVKGIMRVQPKLDGGRAIIFLEMDDDELQTFYETKSAKHLSRDNVIISSRQAKIFNGWDRLRKHLLKLLVPLYRVSCEDKKIHADDADDADDNKFNTGGSNSNGSSSSKKKIIGESIRLDGEFYKHGMPLQEILSIVKKAALNREDAQGVTFHVFDSFYPSDLNDTTRVRQNYINSIFRDKDVVFSEYKTDRTKMIEQLEETERFLSIEDGLGGDGELDMRGYDFIDEVKDIIKHIRKPSTVIPGEFQFQTYNMLTRVPYTKCNNFIDIEIAYQGWLSASFEGVIIRDPSSPYLLTDGDDKSRRSISLLKRKFRYTAEFVVKDFTEIKDGGHAGSFVWVCEIPNSSGKTFSVTPKVGKGAITTLRKMLIKLKAGDFESKYLNTLLTVIFDAYSNDGAPLRGKAIGFRHVD
jgi:hypothetical protein